MIDTPPITNQPARPAVAFVVRPFQPPITRGCVVAGEDGAPQHLTADAIAAIDFYPANPPTTTTGETRDL